MQGSQRDTSSSKSELFVTSDLAKNGPLEVFYIEVETKWASQMKFFRILLGPPLISLFGPIPLLGSVSAALGRKKVLLQGTWQTNNNNPSLGAAAAGHVRVRILIFGVSKWQAFHSVWLCAFRILISAK